MDGAIPLPPPQTSDEPMADAPTTHPYIIDSTDDNDSDWEYEYHPTETDTHYIVLDISSSQPVRNYQGKPRPRDDAPPPPQPPPPASSSAQPQPAAPPESATTTPKTPPPLPEITLKNLHTPTPQLTHNNTLYHCSWSRPLGTDLLLTAPDPSCPSPPDIDILGLSGLKLMARPIKQIQQPRGGAPRSRPPTTTIGRPVVERRERQVAFLERLAEVKRGKGEGDAVRMAGWRPGEDPRGRGRRGRRGRGGGRGAGGVARLMGGGEVDDDDGLEQGERRVRWGNDSTVGLKEARALVEPGEEEEEARWREVVGDEEILQGEEEDEDEEISQGEEEDGDEGVSEGERVRDQTLGEEEAGVGEMEGAEEAADIAADGGPRDDDDEDVAMREG